MTAPGRIQPYQLSLRMTAIGKAAVQKTSINGGFRPIAAILVAIAKARFSDFVRQH
jgi:hypothetical protein